MYHFDEEIIWTKKCFPTIFSIPMFGLENPEIVFFHEGYSKLIPNFYAQLMLTLNSRIIGSTKCSSKPKL